MSKIEFDKNEQPLNEMFTEAREHKNLTLKEAAEHLNLSLTQLTKMEGTTLDLASLTPFERGYIRNYAQLLEVDISQYEVEFQGGHHSGAQLKSMSRYKYPAPQPFFKRGWVKFVLVTGVLLVIILLVMMNFKLDSSV